MNDQELKESIKNICNGYEAMMKVYSEGKILKEPELLDTYLEELNKFITSIIPFTKTLFDGHDIPIEQVEKEPLDITKGLMWNLSRLDLIYRRCKAKLYLFNNRTLDNVFL